MARDLDGIIQIKWANSGDVGLGGLDVNEMWDITYSQPGGPLPQRIQFNQFYRWLSALAVEINQNGPFLDYSALIDYGVGSFVTGSDTFQYYCRVANGPSSSVVDPVGNPTTWKKGSNNTSLVIGADGAIDSSAQLQVANVTSSKFEVSTGGAGGQGSTRKSLEIINANAAGHVDINAFDFDAVAGIKLRINPDGGEVGIGITPTTGKALHVEGSALFNDNVIIGGNGSVIDSGQFQVADVGGTTVEFSTGGAGGQGSARKAMRFENTDANSFMSIDCFDFDTTLPVKLRFNPSGGEVGIGKTPDTGVEFDVSGDIAASSSISAITTVHGGGKILVPDSTSYKNLVSNTTITTTPTDKNIIALGTLSVDDSFIVSFSLKGVRNTSAGRAIILITQTGDGTMESPEGSTTFGNEIYSDSTSGTIFHSFSGVCRMTSAGTCTLTVNAATSVGDFSTTDLGLRVDFLRKA